MDKDHHRIRRSERDRNGIRTHRAIEPELVREICVRKTLKFFHSIASCGIIGALMGYAIILANASQDDFTAYAHARQAIAQLCNMLLLPSLGLALFTGLVATALHRPFHSLRWVWIKAAFGISMFEGTLGLIGAKADAAARISTQIEQGEIDARVALQQVISSEWMALFIITALALLNVVLAIWRPSLKAAAAKADREPRRSDRKR